MRYTRNNGARVSEHRAKREVNPSQNMCTLEQFLGCHASVHHVIGLVGKVR